MSTLFNLKYRPKTFQEFKGNDEAIKALLTSYPDWPSTFLLIGPPGIGKTTLARLIAKQVKCEEINVKEIDAGQDRGIDNIRQITQGALQRPIIGKSKVYIFDECQGLTNESQQALLKITEEAPKDTYFIFCSTDPQKIIKALKERCRAGLINLKPLTNKEVAGVIKDICDNESIPLDGKIAEIARLCVYNAEGIPRNAINTFQSYYQYEDVEAVKSALDSFDETVPSDIWPFINKMDMGGDLGEAVKEYKKLQENDKFVHTKLSVLVGNVFKKKLLKAIEEGNPHKASYYTTVLMFFSEPLTTDIFGEIEFIKRIGLLYNELRNK